MKTLNYRHIFGAFIFGILFVGVPLSAEEDYISEDVLYGEELSGGSGISDPLESLNRYTFKFNDFLLLKVIKPLADGYQAVAPDPVEEGATNFFNNLKFPVRLVGNLLQGRLDGARVETGRFVINATMGVLGVFTPADGIEGYEPIPKEDIGQTLGSWGIGEGPYLVLPLLGPSNLRELGGLLGDRVVNPLDQPLSVMDSWDWEWQVGVNVTEFTVSSPSIVDRYVRLKGSAIDPYSSVKNTYIQFRRAAVAE